LPLDAAVLAEDLCATFSPVFSIGLSTEARTADLPA